MACGRVYVPYAVVVHEARESWGRRIPCPGNICPCNPVGVVG